MSRITWARIRLYANEYEDSYFRSLEYNIKYNKEDISVMELSMSLTKAERNGEGIDQLRQQLHEKMKVRDIMARERDEYESVCEKKKTILVGLMMGFNYNNTIVLTRSEDVNTLAKARDWLDAGKIMHYKLGSSLRCQELESLQNMADRCNIELPPVGMRHMVMQMTTGGEG